MSILGQIDVPDGVSRDWRVETFEITPDAAKLANVRAMWRPLEYVESGVYKRLMRGNTVVMSNTPMEIRTNYPIIKHATGDVLINGLGLGMVLTALLKKGGVRSITVIERSSDVLALVGPTFTSDPRVKLIEADALKFQPLPRERWDAVWHDIWDYICGDNLGDMRALHRKYGRRSDWQGSWCRAECERGR